MTTEALLDRWAPAGLSRQAVWDAHREHQSGRSVTLWREIAGTALCLGGPLGPWAEAAPALRGFIADSKRRGLDPVLAFLDERYPPFLADLHVRPMGSEAIVNLSGFTLRGNRHKRVRQECTRARREGLEFRYLKPPHTTPLLEQMGRVSQSWVRRQRGGEVKLTLGWFTKSFVSKVPAGGVFDAQGRLAAFTTQTAPGGRHTGLDLLRFDPAAPKGAVTLLVAGMLLELKHRGLDSVSLGLAPLSGTDPGPLLRSVRWFLGAGGVYDCDGLYSFKNKFRPEWKPRYVAYGRRRSLFSILIHMAASMREPAREFHAA